MDGPALWGSGIRTAVARRLVRRRLPAKGPRHPSRSSSWPARASRTLMAVGWAAASGSHADPPRRPSTPSTWTNRRSPSPLNAQDAGVADRVAFPGHDAADPAPMGRYDLAMIVEALTLSRPVDVLASVRRASRAGRDADRGGPRGRRLPRAGGQHQRLFYGYSVLDCLPAGMVSEASAETGASCGDRPWSAMPRQRGSGRYCGAVHRGRLPALITGF